MVIFSVALAFIFFSLALLHFYWAIFGIKNPEKVLPTRSLDGKIVIPSSPMTAVIGFGLLLFALIFTNNIIMFWPFHWLIYIKLGIGLIFFLRAIGDFKFVGVFKAVRQTPFAKMDTRYYTPLCFGIALFVLLLHLSG